MNLNDTPTKPGGGGDPHGIKRKLTIKEKILQLKRQRENFGVLDDLNIKSKLIEVLGDESNNLPFDYQTICSKISTEAQNNLPIKNFLVQFSVENIIELRDYSNDESERNFFITTIDYVKLNSLREKKADPDADKGKEIDGDNNTNEPSRAEQSTTDVNNVECILSLQSAKEKENKKISEEILHLLSKPTAKELSLFEQFKSATGHVQEFCQYGVRDECMRVNKSSEPCSKLHFLKIIQKHTDESLGDCSFLNTCFHMESCKYVHYKVEIKNTNDAKDYNPDGGNNSSTNNIPLIKTLASATEQPFKRVLFPAQWIRCDLRFFDMSILGKFAVVMADPPWDIHMELPYGTMQDDEMRNLNIPCLQDDGLIFLWVTGRAMELGRECLQLWGYERCDELIWVKTNQLQRIIRTGRTGHWINHGKEHCLVGVKGNPKNLNRGLDCDVIVAEVRATSHKPDEIYGIIERLSPGSRKIELFGRQHNTQPNWVTLGNQLNDTRLVDPQLVQSYTANYPENAHLLTIVTDE